MAAPAVLIDGVESIVDRYDGFIVDIWGTIYDGGSVFPAARRFLERARDRGLPVAVLSNSPQLPGVVEQRLNRLGLDPTLWSVVLTSGDETRRHLLARSDAFHRGLGSRAHNFAPERVPDILPGTGIEQSEDLASADWILNAGPAGQFDTVADYEDRLSWAARAGLPMICANPDVVVIDRGQRKIHAGALAARYEELGGTVRYHGKPHAPILRRALRILEREASRVLVIGDNRATDIAGAAAVGAGSLLLAGGIHGDRLIAGGAVDPSAVEVFLAEPGARPDWVAACLDW